MILVVVMIFAISVAIAMMTTTASRSIITAVFCIPPTSTMFAFVVIMALFVIIASAKATL